MSSSRPEWKETPCRKAGHEKESMAYFSSMTGGQHEAGGHTITVLVWYAPDPGSPPEYHFNVHIEWPPAQLAPTTPPDFYPASGVLSSLLGRIVWGGVTLTSANPVSAPLEFRVRLACLPGVRARVSVDGTLENVDTRLATYHSAGMTCS